MKHIQVSLLAICLLLSAGYAQQIQNIQFKDMKGKSYNLYTALGEGKSVLVHSTWTEWSSCAQAVPGLNAYWAKYGCDKCNSYKLLVLDVSITDSDTKQATQQYITQHGTKCPCVCAAEGGTTFCTALEKVFGGFPVGAGVTYLIKTDKTVKERPTATEINNAGGNVQHVCPTGIKTGLHHHEAADITIGSLINGKLNIAVRNADTYIIAIHSADGRLVSIVRTRLEQGAHTIVLQNSGVASGIIVVSMKNEKHTITRKILLYK